MKQEEISKYNYNMFSKKIIFHFFIIIIIIFNYSCAKKENKNQHNSDTSLSNKNSDTVLQTYNLVEVDNKSTGDCNLNSENQNSFNGEFICYYIDNSTQRKIYSLSNKSSIFYVYFEGDNTFNIGSVKDDSISGFNILFNGNSTGNFTLNKYSSFTGENISYAGMGSGGGDGYINIVKYGDVGDKMEGDFKMKVCPYNINIHLITCNDKYWYLKGTFSIIRDSNNPNSSNTPY